MSTENKNTKNMPMKALISPETNMLVNVLSRLKKHTAGPQTDETKTDDGWIAYEGLTSRPTWCTCIVFISRDSQISVLCAAHFPWFSVISELLKTIFRFWIMHFSIWCSVMPLKTSYLLPPEKSIITAPAPREGAGHFNQTFRSVSFKITLRNFRDHFWKSQPKSHLLSKIHSVIPLRKKKERRGRTKERWQRGGNGLRKKAQGISVLTFGISLISLLVDIAVPRFSVILAKSYFPLFPFQEIWGSPLWEKNLVD